MHTDGEAYERFMGRWSRRLAPVFLDFVGVQDGQSVLDVGSGTGSVAGAVLSTRQTSRVMGIDASADYIARAGERLQSERVTFEQGDAQRLRFPRASFDRTVSLLVLNFIPDAAAALHEMIRVTKPGGVVAAAVWDYGNGMEMLRFFWDEAIALDPSSDGRHERHMPFSRQGELTRLWREGGLTDVHEVPLTIPLDFAAFDDYWKSFLGGQGPAGAYVSALPDDHRSQLEHRLRARLIGMAEDRRIHLNARAWAVKGTVFVS
jgi:SAM-dependent methyltransferase